MKNIQIHVLKQLMIFLALFLVLSININDLSAQERVLEIDSKVISNDYVTINNQRVPYEVTAGTQPVWGEDGKPIASLFYVYYRKSDVNDVSTRPLVFSFNGGRVLHRYGCMSVIQARDFWLSMTKDIRYNLTE